MTLGFGNPCFILDGRFKDMKRNIESEDILKNAQVG
jgi:hypothetical protein